MPDADAGRGSIPPEVLSVLRDLARQDQEADFRWLAASVGVPPDDIDVLWAWAVWHTHGG